MPLAQAIAPILEAVLDAVPLLLIVDDAQWIDRTSLHALLATLRDFPRARLTLLLASLSEPPREELDELRHRLGHEIPGTAISLGPLDAAALRELASWALPEFDAVALERVSRRVAGDSAGFPFLAVELLSAVAQGLELQSVSAAWPEPFHTMTQSLPGDLPDAVIAALRIGFRRLTPAAQQALAAASVLGDRVTEAVLGRATGLELPVLQAALDELEWQRWLEATGQGYGFVARLARQIIARDMLTPGQRARYRERGGVDPAT